MADFRGSKTTPIEEVNKANQKNIFGHHQNNKMLTPSSLKQITYSNEQKKPKKPPLEKVFSARIELGRQLSPFWRISASQNLSKLWQVVADKKSNSITFLFIFSCFSFRLLPPSLPIMSEQALIEEATEFVSKTERLAYPRR